MTLWTCKITKPRRIFLILCFNGILLRQPWVCGPYEIYGRRGYRALIGLFSSWNVFLVRLLSKRWVLYEISFLLFSRRLYSLLLSICPFGIFYLYNMFLCDSPLLCMVDLTIFGPFFFLMCHFLMKYIHLLCLALLDVYKPFSGLYFIVRASAIMTCKLLWYH